MEIIYIKENTKVELLNQEFFDAQIPGISGVKVDGKRIIVYLTQPLTSQGQSDLDSLIENHNPDNYSFYLVTELVDDQYNALPLQKIDFTLHLKPEIILTKSLVKAPNGRPSKAEYFYEGSKICEITWTFYDVPGGLFYKKEVYLSYVDSKGGLMTPFLIKRKEIDFTVANQLAESIQERVDARGAIVDEIKAVCSGSLQVALSLNLEQVVNLIQPFWNSYETQRKNFIELASRDWMNLIAGLSTTGEYSWLATPVDANGTTCQQYMLYRLGY